MLLFVLLVRSLLIVIVVCCCTARVFPSQAAARRRGDTERGAATTGDCRCHCCFSFTHTQHDTHTQSSSPSGALLVVDGRFTHAGFVCLFRLLLELRRADVVWSVLHRFGYARDLRLKQGYAAHPYVCMFSVLSCVVCCFVLFIVCCIVCCIMFCCLMIGIR